MLSFDWPLVFLFSALPIAVFFLLPRAKRDEAALRIPFYQRVESAMGTSSTSFNKTPIFRAMFYGLIWLLLVSAAAKPQWLGEPISLPSSGRDLLVAVDISGSMITEDMIVENRQIPRILVVKYVVGDFLERRFNDRLGLILFGSQAYLQSPLTFDRTTVNRLLQEAQLGFAGKQTAIGDAIGLAIKRLQDRPESQRVVILLTDGANTAGEVEPRKAADLAKQAKVKIYTVGVGADSMVEFLGPFRQQVNPSLDLDEESLQYIADTTGGKYFRARSPEELEEIYRALDKLEPIEQDEEVFRPSLSLYYWPLGIALVLILVRSLIKLPILFSGRRGHSHSDTSAKMQNRMSKA
ncbi:MAG: VWA domain-containing protein [Agarilytica sp.]